jgi:hypothetical protein
MFHFGRRVYIMIKNQKIYMPTCSGVFWPCWVVHGMAVLSSMVCYQWLERCLACGGAVQSVSLSPGQVEDGSMVLLLPQILGGGGGNFNARRRPYRSETLTYAERTVVSEISAFKTFDQGF